MKRLRFLVILLCVSTILLAQNKKMTLKGECSQLKNGEKLYLLMGPNPVDSAVIKNGKFEFTLKNIQPDEAVIAHKDKEGKTECILLYLDYCNTHVKIEEGTHTTFNTIFMNTTITGNPTDAAVREINDIFLNSKDPGKLYRDSAFIEKLKTVAKRSDLASAYVLRKYNQVFLVNNMQSLIQESLSGMSPAVKESIAAKELQEIYNRKAKLAIGAIAPDFTLNTPDNKPISMHEYIKGKKLILIDFWASWCAPCRKEGENVKAIYEDYHSKGFDVLGVSLDNKLEAWKEAIQKDGITWGQVSDLQGWKTPIAKLYDFSGIPCLYLVDGNGRIVAKNLRGEALRQKVAEICK